MKALQKHQSLNNYLVTGLGNMGEQYMRTRHNAGFMVVDAIAQTSACSWKAQHLGHMTRCIYQDQVIYLLKPSTYMNQSGLAIKYWMQKLHICQDKLLVIVDDTDLIFGQLRIRGQGGDAGHQGLKNIEAHLLTTCYARLRLGIGQPQHSSEKKHYVLDTFTIDEQMLLPKIIYTATQAVFDFCAQGLIHAMNVYNKS